MKSDTDIILSFFAFSDRRCTLLSYPQTLLGSGEYQIVGIRYYDGIAHPGEYVSLVREPRNPYDINAIRVDNLRGEKVGHIKATMAKSLAPIMDNGNVHLEGTIPRAGNEYTLPLVLDFFSNNAIPEQAGAAAIAAANLKAELKRRGDNNFRLARDFVPGAQGIAECDIRYNMPGAIDSLISSGIKSISTDALELASNPPLRRRPPIITTPEERVACLEQTLDDMVEYNRKMSDIMFRLIDMISTNAFVSATIQDRVIGSIESVTSSQTAPVARPTVQHTPASDPVILQVSTSGFGADDQSSISAQSITELLTPRWAKGSKKRSSTHSDNDHYGKCCTTEDGLEVTTGCSRQNV